MNDTLPPLPNWVFCDDLGGLVPSEIRSAMVAYARAALAARPAVPAGFVLVPVEVLEDAATAIGHFVSDHGWSAEDMQAMDNLDAYIARHKANAAAPVTSSPAPVHGWTDADADAGRLALELECILTDGDTPMPLTSRWWESSHEALALHRRRISDELREIECPPDPDAVDRALEAEALQDEAAAELRRLDHNNRVLTDALWKACGDDKATVNATIESQGALK